MSCATLLMPSGAPWKNAPKSLLTASCAVFARRAARRALPIYQVALLARRLTGKYLAPEAKHLTERVKEMETGKYDDTINELNRKSVEELTALYNARDIEK